MDPLSSDVLSQLVADANRALEFKLVRTVEDLEDESTAFEPEMSHQIFGENESVFGYKDLRVKLYYAAASLRTYLGIEYSNKIQPDRVKGLKADDIVEKLDAVLPSGYLTNVDDFIKCLAKEADFRPYGELVHSFSASSDGVERTFEVYFCETSTPNFLKYHARLQTFLLWYVDAASFIDTEDDRWTFFVIYERYRTCDGDPRWAVNGICTVYRYYAYPKHTRPRISQVLILPPFRRLGLGAQLLQAVYKYFVSCGSVIDITVEDPSDDFQRLRDFVDAQNCKDLPAFSPKSLSTGFDKEMAVQARRKYRINPKQARRIYEILRLRNTDTTDVRQYREYRLDVKNRLNAPFQKKKNDLKKLQKYLKPEEYAAAVSSLGIEETFQRLNLEYQALEECYKRVIDRLDS